MNWLDAGPLDDAGRTVSVKLRSAMPAAPATVADVGAGGLTLRLATPQYGVSPGQAAVCYDGTRVLGGGWIDSAELTAANAPADVAPDRAAAPA